MTDEYGSHSRSPLITCHSSLSALPDNRPVSVSSFEFLVSGQGKQPEIRDPKPETRNPRPKIQNCRAKLVTSSGHAAAAAAALRSPARGHGYAATRPGRRQTAAPTP